MKRTINDVIAYCDEFGVVCRSKHYKNCNTDLEFICKKCGGYFKKSFRLFQLSKHKVCRHCDFNKKTTINDVINLAKKLEITCTSDTCKNNRDILSFTCKDCHDSFNRTYHDLKKSKNPRCNSCTIKYNASLLRKSQDDFIEDLKVKNMYVYSNYDITGTYTGARNKIQLTDSYGKYEITPDSLLCGCRPDIRSCIDKEEYLIKKAEEVHGKLYGYNHVAYTQMHEDIIITCYKHGNFQQRASHHIDGSGCPTCKSSKAEKLIGQMLSDANILFNREYLFGGCYGFGTVDMPFDFYIHELNLAIEYDGEFHYLPIYGEEGLERQKFRDSRKDDFCKNKSINLLRIPYWDFKNIEQILLNEVINHA